MGRHLIALAATLAFMQAYHYLGFWPGPEPIPFAIALFLATVHGHRALAIGAAVVAAVLVTVPQWSFEDLPQVLPTLTAVIAIGEIVRIRRAYLRQARQRAVDAERLRISRELHDVLVHHMSVVNVQAGAALHRPHRATDALMIIRQASRDALDEVRGALGTLRAPSIRQLDELIDRVRTDGLVVSKRIRGRIELPAEVDQAAYRVVQEALTNVVRHADATKVAVHLDCRPDQVTVQVRDNGKGGDALPGNGLTGMRERVAALGGQLTTSGESGFRVEARIPL
ncbi:two-component sensor histidine kinase [Kibdelosporangium aridum]|uniref:histidine kinase n=1 Tax=Kibdelosporangium aridum TaxID=2030 RepID=A0A428YYC2_KIBAR|nr:sensor histidine kinase [Kibdelosporangium aridum]RSM75379.1 two-component sensor histidine kinase [Kibdelosporangium aridum]